MTLWAISNTFNTSYEIGRNSKGPRSKKLQKPIKDYKMYNTDPKAYWVTKKSKFIGTRNIWLLSTLLPSLYYDTDSVSLLFLWFSHILPDRNDWHEEFLMFFTFHLECNEMWSYSCHKTYPRATIGIWLSTCSVWFSQS